MGQEQGDHDVEEEIDAGYDEERNPGALLVAAGEGDDGSRAGKQRRGVADPALPEEDIALQSRVLQAELVEQPGKVRREFPRDLRLRRTDGSLFGYQRATRALGRFALGMG